MLCRERSAPMFAVNPLPAIRCFSLTRYSGVASAPMNGSSFVRVSRPVVGYPAALICFSAASKLHVVHGRLKHPIGQRTLAPSDGDTNIPAAVAAQPFIVCRRNSRRFMFWRDLLDRRALRRDGPPLSILPDEGVGKSLGGVDYL